MTAPIDEWTQDIHRGDAVDTLREMPESSVHCVMTSPPYYGLRDYGEGVVSVFGGDEDCEHDWQTRTRPAKGGENSDENPPGVGANDSTQDGRLWGSDGIESQRCAECGAWRGQLGLEPSLDQYVRNLAYVGQEVMRVLRPDGSWWLNLGDSFGGSGGAGGQWTDESHGTAHYSGEQGDSYNGPLNESQFRRKNKMLVPHRVAIALQESGWIVRADAPWVKPNPMPHPVKDRLNEHKEFVFHLTPEPDYWFDLDSIREPHKEHSLERSHRKDNRHEHSERQSVANEETLNPDQFVHPNGKNPGDVLEITVQPFPEAHFAVYPPALVETPIKSSCPPQVCAECGTPYTRTRDVKDREVGGGVSRVPEDERGYGNRQGQSQNGREGLTQPTGVELGEWAADCDCDTGETEPGIVLDPFAGAGTTCLVAKELVRRFVGIDLNEKYVTMAQKRIGVDVDNPELLIDDDQTTLSGVTE